MCTCRPQCGFENSYLADYAFAFVLLVDLILQFPLASVESSRELLSQTVVVSGPRIRGVVHGALVFFFPCR